MQIRVAKNIGFCFGVRRAVDMALRAKESLNGDVYTLGKLIHNDSVVDELRAKGVIPVQNIDEIPKGATVIIRSHGISPSQYEAIQSRGVSIVDATCPFVKRIHEIVDSHYKKGYRIAIIGERSHPEVIGINGWCNHTAIFMQSANDVGDDFLSDRFCVVVQTTFSKETFDEIASKIRKMNAETVIFDTICSTTVDRQNEASALSRACSKMILIGSRNSSNTQKLLSVCRKHAKDMQFIEKLSELSLENMESSDIIGIIAGASTPDWMIGEVITRMSDLEKTMAENTEAENKEEETEVSAAAEPSVNAVITETAEQARPNEEPMAMEVPSEVTNEPEAVKEAEEETAEQAEQEPGQEAAEQAEQEVRQEAKQEVDKKAEKETESKDQTFAEAFESTLVRIKNGQVITGSIVQIVDGEVCVNIGYKSDGFIPRNEFSSDPDIDPEDVCKIGDPIDVEVIKVNDGEGNVLLSRKNVESKKLWDELIRDEDVQDKVFEGVGKEVVKGGLIAYIDGVRAFVPASQLSTKYIENISEFVGKTIKLKVIEVDKARKRIVASHKAILLFEAEEAKKKLWDQLVVGAKVNGIVRRLTDFGAFVDIGGIDGLVHVTDVAWGRVKHPSDVLSIGQEIEVLIRDVDMEKQRVSLGYKQLQPKPWTMADQKYPVGSVVEGKVVRIVPFGAFVALEPTIDGLIHISQVGVKRIAKVEDEINVGDIVRCKVLDVNPEAKRISLSRRDVVLEENPEIAEELAREREERERAAAERAEQRAAAQEQAKQQALSASSSRDVEKAERPERAERSERPERPERRSRREDADYQLPPVQQTTTSLAGLFLALETGETSIAAGSKAEAEPKVKAEPKADMESKAEAEPEASAEEPSAEEKPAPKKRATRKKAEPAEETPEPEAAALEETSAEEAEPGLKGVADQEEAAQAADEE